MGKGGGLGGWGLRQRAFRVFGFDTHVFCSLSLFLSLSRSPSLPPSLSLSVSLPPSLSLLSQLSCSLESRSAKPQRPSPSGVAGIPSHCGAATLDGGLSASGVYIYIYTYMYVCVYIHDMHNCCWLRFSLHRMISSAGFLCFLVTDPQ